MPCRGFTDFSGVLKVDGFHSRSATCCGLLCEWQWHAFTSVDPKIQDSPKTDGETILYVQHVFAGNGSIAIFSIRFISSTDHTCIRPRLTTLSKWWRLNGCFDTNYLHKPGNKKTRKPGGLWKAPPSNTESWHSVLRPWAWSSWSARKIGWRRPGWDLKTKRGGKRVCKLSISVGYAGLWHDSFWATLTLRNTHFISNSYWRNWILETSSRIFVVDEMMQCGYFSCPLEVSIPGIWMVLGETQLKPWETCLLS